MDVRDAVALLNDLLDLETHSLLTRLDDVQPFVGGAAADEQARLAELARDGADYRQRLAETIIGLGGVPRPAAFDMDSAAAHYVSAEHLLAQLMEQTRRAIRAYERAAEAAGSSPQAGAVLAANLSGHRAHLEALEQLAGRAT